MIKETKISDIFDSIRNGYSVKQSDNATGVPITRIETISNRTIDQTKFGYANISENNLGKAKDFLLEDGDILMTHINSISHLGKSALYVEKPKMLIHGMNLLCLRAKRDIASPKYLLYWFNSPIFKTRLIKYINPAVNQASVSTTNLKKLTIPLPPLPIQQKIAAILDAADLHRRKTKTLIEKYDQLTQSIFLEMFGDPVKNEKGWKKVLIEDISNIVTKGESPKWQGFDYLEKGVRFLTSENVRLGFIELKTDKFIAEEFHNKLKRSRLKQNDLLVNLVGASIGRGALVKDEHLPANINQAVAKIEPSLEKINPKFLLHLIITPQIQEKLIGNKVDGARANISLKNVRELEIILPPLNQQNQFSKTIDNLEKQTTEAKRSLLKSEDLFNTLLQRAFKGELVN
jgi:type I restriction enzyme, S subunit